MRTTFGVPGASATFGYVVVDGGSAGLTIASRLIENPTLIMVVAEAENWIMGIGA